MTASEYGTAEEATFKQCLVDILPTYVNDPGDVTDTNAVDYDGRRRRYGQRKLLDDAAMVQIEFTLAVDMDAAGYASSETGTLASDVGADLATAISGGTLDQALVANAASDSALSAVHVAVNESAVVLDSTEVTGVEMSSSESIANSEASSGSQLSIVAAGGGILALVVLTACFCTISHFHHKNRSSSSTKSHGSVSVSKLFGTQAKSNQESDDGLEFSSPMQSARQNAAVPQLMEGGARSSAPKNMAPKSMELTTATVGSEMEL